MTPADQALSHIERHLGGARLAFDASGLAQVTVEDTFVLNLQRIDDRNLRLVTYLDGIIRALTARFLLNTMTTNHAGAVGPRGRFGLHEVGGILALVDVVDVAILDAAAFEARVLAFVKTAAYWTDNADTLFDAENPLETLVHSTGSAMSDAEFLAFEADDLLVRV